MKNTFITCLKERFPSASIRHLNIHDTRRLDLPPERANDPEHEHILLENEDTDLQTVTSALRTFCGRYGDLQTCAVRNGCIQTNTILWKSATHRHMVQITEFRRQGTPTFFYIGEKSQVREL